MSATVGAAGWALLALAARLQWLKIGAIELMFLFAPLVIVPLGMELARGLVAKSWAAELGRKLQPVGAPLAIVALCLPPGVRASLFAGPWMIVCGLMAYSGAAALLQLVRHSSRGAAMPTRPQQLVQFVIAVARIDLAIGAAWLVASRLGMRPLGIQEPIGLLTAVHFHYAGFATATIAAATLQFAKTSRPGLPRLVVMMIVMPFILAAGFVISPLLKMAAAGLFSLSVAAFAVFLRSLAKRARDGMARVMLQIASTTVFAGMVLAVAYAIADFAGSDALPIPQMARTHGILNAMGFCLPGLLGWLVENSHEPT